MTDIRFLDQLTVLGSVGGISIDVIDKTVETYEHIITQNPTATGSPISDHIVNLPVKITIEGGFSDISISKLVGTVLPTDSIKGRAKQQFDSLLTLFENKEVFTVFNGVHLFADMQFKSLQLTKDNDDFALSFSAELWSLILIDINGTGEPERNLADYAAKFRFKRAILTAVGASSTNTKLRSLGVLA